MTVLEAVQKQLASPDIFADRLGIGKEKIERLLSNMDFDPVTGCWLWQKSLVKGYGVVKIRCLSNSIIPVHRVCHELAKGKVSKELHVHHQVEEPVKCSGRSCANPDHTKSVTVREHIVELTPGTVSNIAAHRDHCEAGHPYTPENTRIVKGGSRQCRACDRIRAQEKRDSDRTRPKYAKDPAKLKKFCFRGHSLEDESNIRLINSSSGPQKVCLACEKIRRDWYKARDENEYLDPPSAILKPDDRCKRGHLLDGDNVYYHPDGKRRSCKACRAINFTKSGKDKEFEMAPPARLPLPLNEEELAACAKECELLNLRTQGPVV